MLIEGSLSFGGVITVHVVRMTVAYQKGHLGNGVHTVRYLM